MDKSPIETHVVAVSIVVAMRNSATTVLHTLRSIESQDYPIVEIIVVDNASTDRSVAEVESFRAASRTPIRILRHTANQGLAASFNAGVLAAMSPLVILMHSDGSLPSTGELRKLVVPILSDSAIVATTPTVLMPENIWLGFNFWQRCLFSRAAGVAIRSSCGKFDCVRRDVFLRIGGFDTLHYGDTIGFGGEDSDLYIRLAREGRVAFTDATVIHLHYMAPDYSAVEWFRNRRLLARTYGRLLNLHFHSMTMRNRVLMLVKPVLALLPLLPRMHVAGIVALAAFALAHSRRMYFTSSSYRDGRIFLLPFLDIAMVYFETFWTIQGLLSRKTASPATGTTPVGNV